MAEQCRIRLRESTGAIEITSGRMFVGSVYQLNTNFPEGAILAIFASAGKFENDKPLVNSEATDADGNCTIDLRAALLRPYFIPGPPLSPATFVWYLIATEGKVIGRGAVTIHYAPVTFTADGTAASMKGEKGEKGDKGDKGDAGLVTNIGCVFNETDRKWHKLVCRNVPEMARNVLVVSEETIAEAEVWNSGEQGETIAAHGEALTEQGEMIAAQGETIAEQGETIAAHTTAIGTNEIAGSIKGRITAAEGEIAEHVERINHLERQPNVSFLYLMTATGGTNPQYTEGMTTEQINALEKSWGEAVEIDATQCRGVVIVYANELFVSQDLTETKTTNTDNWQPITEVWGSRESEAARHVPLVYPAGIKIYFRIKSATGRKSNFRYQTINMG